MIRIAISILNFNSAECTIACVQSVLESADVDVVAREVVVYIADNASSSADWGRLQRHLGNDERIHIRSHEVNLGFAAGHNRNIEAILATSRPDFIWLLNNDCTVERGCIDALLSCAAESPCVGIWGATLLEPDGRTIQCAGGCFYNSWLSSYRQYARGKAVSQRSKLKPAPFSYLAGASLFLPVGTLQNGLGSPAGVGPGPSRNGPQLLNESFFLYFEELDLAKRLKSGLTIEWCRNALITHKGGGSTGAVHRQRGSQAEYHATLSALKFTHLYYPRRLWVMAPARYLAKILQLLLTRNLRLVASLNSAYRDFWLWRRGCA